MTQLVAHNEQMLQVAVASHRNNEIVGLDRTVLKINCVLYFWSHKSCHLNLRSSRLYLTYRELSFRTGLLNRTSTDGDVDSIRIDNPISARSMRVGIAGWN